MGRQRRGEPKCRGRDRKQRDGKIKRGGRGRDQGGKNARETSTWKNSLSSFSLSFPLFISFFLALSSPVCAAERLPILRQGQDRDFNQLAGFLGPGK